MIENTNAGPAAQGTKVPILDSSATNSSHGYAPNALECWDKGYRDLLPVIPPDAVIAPSSSVPASAIGKSPGQRLPNLTWTGFPWQKYVASSDAVSKWMHEWNANTGLLAGDTPAVDIDVLEPELAKIIYEFVTRRLGDTVCRTGRAPKKLLMYRLDGERFARLRLWVTCADGTKHLVETLANGCQYLLCGVHPGTRRLYTLDRELPNRPDLPARTLADFKGMLTELAELLTLLGYTCELEGDGRIIEHASVDQVALLAPSIDELRHVVSLIPNGDDVPRDGSGHSYIRMAYSVRAAAGGGHFEDGFNIFAAWAETWTGGVNDPEVMRADYRRSRGGTVGFPLLADMARAYGYEGDSGFTALAAETPAPEDVLVAPLAKTEQWLASLVAERHADKLRYCAELRQWFVFTGQFWAPDAVLRSEQIIDDELIRIAADEARKGATDAEKRRAGAFGARISTGATASTVRTIMTRRDAVAIGVDSFDTDPMLLATRGGTVELATGLLRSANPDDLCSKLAGATPTRGIMPVFDKFLDEITLGDADYARYLQTLFGYAATGRVDEQIVPILTGTGGNGKSILVEAVAGVLGTYATTAAFSVFTESKYERHSTELAALESFRLVIASESDSGARWNVGLVKAISGGDKISARRMRENSRVWKPVCTVVFNTNHLPAVRDIDDAFRRRIRVLPFAFKPTVVDRQLPAKLAKENNQILSWVLDGAVRWAKEGLGPMPAVVERATFAYFNSNDPLARWLDDGTRKAAGVEVGAGDAFTAFRSWAYTNGEDPKDVKWFASQMTQRGWEKKHTRDGKVYVGIRLVPPRPGVRDDFSAVATLVAS